MGLIYTMEFERQTIAAASGDVDLFYLAPGDDAPIKIHGLTLDVTSELGDAAEEILAYRVIRGHTTVGSGGTAVTPRAVNPRNATAALGTFRTLDTTVASLGTVQDLHSGAYNLRVGERFFLPERLLWICTQAETSIVIRLMEAVDDDVTASGTLYFEQ